MEQKQGVLARWFCATSFTATDVGTKIMDKIDFDPPGGNARLSRHRRQYRKDMEKMMAHREKKLKEIFAKRAERLIAAAA